MLGRKYSGWSIVIALVFGSASVNRAQSNLPEVTTPDHRITLRFDVQPQKGQEAGKEGQLVYSVSFNEKPAFENSTLGLELADQPPLGAAVHIAGTTPVPAWMTIVCSQAKPPRSTTPTTASQFTRWRARALDASSISRRAFITAQWPFDTTSPSKLRYPGISLPRRIRSFVP